MAWCMTWHSQQEFPVNEEHTTQHMVTILFYTHLGQLQIEVLAQGSSSSAAAVAELHHHHKISKNFMQAHVVQAASHAEVTSAPCKGSAVSKYPLENHLGPLRKESNHLGTMKTDQQFYEK